MIIGGKSKENLESPGNLNMPMYYKDNWSSEKKPNNALKEISPIKSDINKEVKSKGAELLNKFIKKITIRGLASQNMPSASYVIPILNLLPHCEKYNPDAKNEIELLLALSLLNGRRFVQACEILRKIQSRLINFQNSKSEIPPIPSPRIQWSQSINIKCAKIEILIADAMNPHFQLHEKLKSLKRAIDFAMNIKVSKTNISPPSKFSHEDIYTFLTRIHPNLVKLLVNLLTDRNEAVKMAAIRTLDFTVENMGCSLGNHVYSLLKNILAIFPGSPQSANLLLNDSQNSGSGVNSSPAVEPSPRFPALKQLITETSKSQNMGNINVFPQSDKISVLFNHLLETFGSVLSSVSSHILHKIFYDIVLAVTYSPESNPELRAVILGITEKILNICQGDLIPTSIFLNGVLKDQGSSNKKLASSAQNLWSAIRTKLCPNCDRKSRKRLIQWILENLISIAEKKDTSTCSKETAEEDACLKLGTYIDIIQVMISTNKSEEEQIANPLVILSQNNDKTDFYELLKPLLYWMNFAMANESRVELFQKIWKCVGTLLQNMKQTINFDYSPLILPLLSHVNEYCKHSSPTLPMLKFLITLLKDFKDFNTLDSNKILIELYNNISTKIPNFPYEEIFVVFDQISEIILEEIPADIFMSSVNCLLDRYTSKCKKQQETLQKFVKRINELSSMNIKVDNKSPADTFFGIIIKSCILENKDILVDANEKDHKKSIFLHDAFVSRLNFAIDTIKALNQISADLFKYLVCNNTARVEEFLSELLSNGHSSIRLKVFEFLESVCNYFISFSTKNSEESKELETFIEKEQFIITKYVLTVIKKSNPSDSYMQFNCLTLLDLLFHYILPVPTFDNEIHKRKSKTSPTSKTSKLEILDLENFDISTFPENLQITDSKYLHARLMVGLKVWPFIKMALNSPWSNIRSVCYGLICSLVKLDTNDYRGSFKDKLKSALLPPIVSLLSSKESEAKAGGLNILGTFMGLGYDTGNADLTGKLRFFKRNTEFVSVAIWQQVYELQEDWDETIKEAASVLIQLCAPKESVVHFHQIKEESNKLKLNSLSERYANISLASLNDIMSLSQSLKIIDTDQSNMPDVFDSLGKMPDIQNSGHSHIFEQGLFTENTAIGTLNESSHNDSLTLEQKDEQLFYIEKLNNGQIKEIISIFKNDFKPPKNLWLEEKFNDNVQDEESVQEHIFVPEAEKSNELSQKYQMVDILEDKLVGAKPIENVHTENSQKPQHSIMQNQKICSPQQIQPKMEAINKPENKQISSHIPAEKHIKKQDSLDAEPYRFLPAGEEGDQDELEIIELPEGDDFFGKLEDGNVPVIKNTFADKKNKRPAAPKPRSKVAKIKIDLEPEILLGKELDMDKNINYQDIKKHEHEPNIFPDLPKKEEDKPKIEETKPKIEEAKPKIEEAKPKIEEKQKTEPEIKKAEDKQVEIELPKQSEPNKIAETVKIELPQFSTTPKQPYIQNSKVISSKITDNPLPPLPSTKVHFDPPKSLQPENSKVKPTLQAESDKPKPIKSEPDKLKSPKFQSEIDPLIIFAQIDPPPLNPPKNLSKITIKQSPPIVSRRKPRTNVTSVNQKPKGNQSLLMDSKTQMGTGSSGKIKKQTNKSFEHNATRASSRPGNASRSCLKNTQNSSPAKLSFSKKDENHQKRRKVHSTRSKQNDGPLSTGQKNTKKAKKSSHSSSLPATPRVEQLFSYCKKGCADPEKMLADIKFRGKRKEKHHKRQPQQNFAKTSPALAAILKSLRPTTTKAADDNLLKSYRTNFLVGTLGSLNSEQESVHKRPVKVTVKKGDPGWYVPVQTINITTEQINFKTADQDRPAPCLMNNYLGNEDDKGANQTY